MSIRAENTTAVLLAAGHGKRMLPLTEQTPKPLLKIGEHALIEHHLFRLADLGFKNIVINIAYLADQISLALGDGSRYGLHIHYSDESASGALETAGGLKNALPLIKSDPFITVNADIWTDFDFTQLLLKSPESARLVMTENPPQHPDGDFVLQDNGTLALPSKQGRISQPNTLTFTGIAIYRKQIFEDLDKGKQALAPIFRKLIASSQLEGVKLKGQWRDIGTPERLAELNDYYSSTHFSA